MTAIAAVTLLGGLGMFLLGIHHLIEDTSKQLRAERQTGREQLLEEVALQHVPAATARAALDTLGWTDLALYHSWRLAESLRIASGK